MPRPNPSITQTNSTKCYLNPPNDIIITKKVNRAVGIKNNM